MLDLDVCKTAVLESGVEFDAAGRISYTLLRTLARSLLTQGFSVVLDSPCRFQQILDTGLQLAEDTGACYRYVECASESGEFESLF